MAKVRKHVFPGLVCEERNGSPRWRVREKGRAGKKTAVSVGPEHPDFLRQYALARQGVSPMRSEAAILKAKGDLDAAISQAMSRAKTRSKKKNVPFDLTTADLFDLLERQDYRCGVSRVRFEVKRFALGARCPNNISIHRINPAKGYVSGNIRLVTTIVNIAISDFGEAEFLKMCRAVTTALCTQDFDGYSER